LTPLVRSVTWGAVFVSALTLGLALLLGGPVGGW